MVMYQELLWLLKHPNLYTGGISAPDNELIDKNKFPVFKTNRGGKWTFHGDGQKVVYFVINLNKRDKLPEHYKVFPYVNGGLFKNFYDIPNFFWFCWHIFVSNLTYH